MLKIIAPTLAVAFLAVLVMTGGSPVTASNTDNFPRPDGLTVHEWGTFTTVAGLDGRPIEWLPLGGPADLPCFVEHFDNNPFIKSAPNWGAQLSYADARSRLKAKVRMETPVLYFYAPREQTVNVKVDFRGGLVTEWYPKATVSQMAVQEKTLSEKGGGSNIEWKNVKITPDSKAKFQSDGRPSHYYTARETEAAPVQAAGKDEKFLFYRGIGNFEVPISAQVTSAGKILVTASSGDAIPAIVLFENRGGKIGYRVHGAFQGELKLDIPELGSDARSLQSELEEMLTASGLYAKEAQAMVKTWRDSWFEEGTRLFYIVPKHTVDTILPLRVDPSPAHAARSFVGRMEVITPAIVKTVQDAISANDTATLTKYARFLGPITDRIERKDARTQALLDSTYKAFLGEVAAGCR